LFITVKLINKTNNNSLKIVVFAIIFSYNSLLPTAKTEIKKRVNHSMLLFSAITDQVIASTMPATN
jgi:hypothetical protein